MVLLLCPKIDEEGEMRRVLMRLVQELIMKWSSFDLSKELLVGSKMRVKRSCIEIIELRLPSLVKENAQTTMEEGEELFLLDFRFSCLYRVLGRLWFLVPSLGKKKVGVGLIKNFLLLL